MNDGTGRTIPLWVKCLYTAFVAVLVPYYWVTYTPWNFLFFCDVALLITLAALWLESPLLASVPAVGIILPQFVWVFDLCTGGRVVGLAGYMFDPKLSLFVRGLSSFHGWLPFVLLWLVWRLGYDRRALAAQVVLTWVLLLVCYAFGPEPPAQPDRPNAAVNINYVFGLGFDKPQTAMPPLAWLAILMTALPAVIQVPSHFALRWGFEPKAGHEPIDPTPGDGATATSPGTA
jgi:hypothetical protein